MDIRSVTLSKIQTAMHAMCLIDWCGTHPGGVNPKRLAHTPYTCIHPNNQNMFNTYRWGDDLSHPDDGRSLVAIANVL